MTLTNKHRAAIVCVLVAGVAGTYYMLRPTRRAHTLPYVAGYAREAPWFEKQRRLWETYDYADIRDSGALTDQVGAWVRARPTGGPQIDEALLVRDIAGFLRALSAASADEYVKAYGGQREFRTDIAADQFVQACYHEVTGKTIPSEMPRHQLLVEFWRGHPQAVQRPAAVASEACIEVALSKPLSTSNARRPDDPFYARTLPAFAVYSSQALLERWQAPISRALIRITRPRVGLDQVLGKYDVTPVCKLYCVVRTTDGSTGLLDLYLYFSPDEQAWHVEIGSTGFGKHVFWAI